MRRGLVDEETKGLSPSLDPSRRDTLQDVGKGGIPSGNTNGHWQQVLEDLFQVLKTVYE